jgi:hypothetical protein
MTDDPKPCTRCGRPHTKCTAHTRAGNPCGQKPMSGQGVCRMHGGSAPQSLEAAERRRTERQALLAAESFGLPREVDPHTALLEELHRTAGAVQWLGAIVADLDQGDIVWGRTKEKLGGEDAGTTREARPNAFVLLWQSERDRLAKVAKTCVDVGIEERRVRIAESAGQQLASVVRAVLDRLQLTDEQRVLALAVVPEEFRRLGDVVPGEVVERPAGGAA